MEISLHSNDVVTKIEFPQPLTAVFPDKGDTLVIWLGINRVVVRFIDGQWVIQHNSNIQTELVPTTGCGDQGR